MSVARRSSPAARSGARQRVSRGEQLRRHEAGHDGGDGDVEHRADAERPQHAARQIALRRARLLGERRDASKPM